MSPASQQPDLARRFAALSDSVRLRMLRLLGNSELSVGELARVLQLPQSTVSRHLKTLHEGGWIVRRSEGTASLYQLVESELDDSARSLWSLAQSQLSASPACADDDARLREALAERRIETSEYFGRVGGNWDQVRQELAALLPRDWVVADLGCGTGNATEVLAPFVRQVVAIDREPAMLEAARARLGNVANVEFREGELTDLPLQPAEINAATDFLVMHHLDAPATAVQSAAKALKPGGVLMIVDMVRHDRTDYRHTMGHKHLGFAQDDIDSWARAAELADPSYTRLRPHAAAKGPGLFVATMKRPAG